MPTIRNKITAEEIEHIIKEFITKNMAKDLAMLFITQDDIEYDDFKYFTWDNKYKKTFYDFFDYLNAYICEFIAKEKFDNIINILYKLPLYSYKPIEDKYGIDNDYICTKIFNNIISILCNDISTYRFEELFSFLAMKNEDLCKGFILCNWRLLNEEHMRVILLAEWLNPNDWIQVILQQYRRTGDINLIPRIIDSCIVDTYYMIPLVDNIFNRYRFSTSIINNKAKVVYDIPLTDNSRMKRAIEMMRSYLCSKIQSDADFEIYNFLETSRLRYLESRDILRASIYDSIVKYLFGGNNTKNRIKDMIIYGQEDMSMIVDDVTQFTIANDMLIGEYLYNAKELSPYDMFIRIYNINRFQFLRRGCTDFINEYFNMNNTYESAIIIKLATSQDFWLCCNLFNKATVI